MGRKKMKPRPNLIKAEKFDTNIKKVEPERNVPESLKDIQRHHPPSRQAAGDEYSKSDVKTLSSHKVFPLFMWLILVVTITFTSFTRLNELQTDGEHKYMQQIINIRTHFLSACDNARLPYLYNLYWNTVIKPFTSFVGSMTKATHLQVVSANDIAESQNMNEKKSRNDNKNKKLKKILLWTSFFGNEDFEFGLGHEPFINNGCKETRCVVTKDKAEYSSSDLVIFHMREVRDRTMPKEVRPKDQIWAFTLKESPWLSWIHQFKGMKSVFNWTVTYRLDSDVPWLYGTFRELSYKEKQDRIQLLKDKDYSSGKTKMVSWMSSACPRISERDEYTAQLSKFVDVHIYGRCGNLSCPGDSCYHLFNTTYKFYLAFENAICRDYISERLFRTMFFDIIPIVLGGGNYSQIAPPHSYIDVRDYPSARHLARYLKYLDKNATAYNEYFAWKTNYIPVLLNGNTHQLFCDICNKLNMEDVAQGKFYPDIQAWWNREDCEGGIFDLLEDLHGVKPI